MSNILTPANPNFEQTVREHLKGQHFMNLMGFDLTKIEAGRVEGEMPIQQKHNQQFGYIHGGVTSTLLDITMGFSAFTLVSKDHGVVTANLNVDFVKPGSGEIIKAVSYVEKSGKRFFVCKGHVYTIKNGRETLIATASSVMAVVNLPSR